MSFVLVGWSLAMGCNIYLWCFIVLVIILLLSTVPSSQIGGLIVCLHFKGSDWPFVPRIFYGNDWRDTGV